MGIINLITAICFSILTAEVLYMVISLIVKNREDRIAFMRSFKKGKCAIIYFSAIPLFCVGHMYAGADFFAAFFNAVNQIINLVVLKYSTSSVQALVDANLFYKITMYYSFVLVGINALLFTFSLVGQRLWEFRQLVKAKISSKDKLFIFGYNQNSVAVYNSDGVRGKVIIDKISGQDGCSLYTKKISFVSCSSFDNFIAQIFKMVARGKKQYTVIINTNSEENNLSICRGFIAGIEKEDKGGRENIFNHLRIYVFGDPRYKAIYEDAMESAYGCLHYINKYQMIAMNFIDNYPFTKFMDERHIDYSTTLIRKGIDINFCMIGFGKTNRQIFLTSVANNQFLSEDSSKISPKKVKYHIFDRNPAENNKNLNHSYYRFRDECSNVDPDDYLPLPSLPAEENYYQLDINNSKFYHHIRQIVSANPNDMNFIIIGFGTDLENIDMAQKLVEKRQEWHIENLVIFVKVRALHKEQTLLEQEGCYFIGNENDCVYDIDAITGDNIFHMAQMRNETYDLEYKITHEKLQTIDSTIFLENRINANKNWYLKKSQLERESSLYCCLSLKSKLNLMGLDYCSEAANDLQGLTEQEYLEIYAVGDSIDTSTYPTTVNGKKIVNYTLDFIPSKRTNLAMQEHQRWNSFMLSKGMIPSTIDEILNEKIMRNGVEQFTNGKNYKIRKHGNITTFEGLITFRKLIADRDHADELEKDVIKYDYQLMDDAYWLLKSCGYKIVKLQPK